PPDRPTTGPPRTATRTLQGPHPNAPRRVRRPPRKNLPAPGTRRNRTSPRRPRSRPARNPPRTPRGYTPRESRRPADGEFLQGGAEHVAPRIASPPDRTIPRRDGPGSPFPRTTCGRTGRRARFVRSPHGTPRPLEHRRVASARPRRTELRSPPRSVTRGTPGLPPLLRSSASSGGESPPRSSTRARIRRSHRTPAPPRDGRRDRK